MVVSLSMTFHLRLTVPTYQNIAPLVFNVPLFEVELHALV